MIKRKYNHNLKIWYFCKWCGHWHLYTSKVGENHFEGICDECGSLDTKHDSHTNTDESGIPISRDSVLSCNKCGFTRTLEYGKIEGEEE